MMTGCFAVLSLGQLACSKKPPHHVRIFRRIPPQRFGYHHVKKGDTLQSIARSNHLSAKQLAKINHLPAPYVIHPGQYIALGRTAYKQQQFYHRVMQYHQARKSTKVSHRKPLKVAKTKVVYHPVKAAVKPAAKTMVKHAQYNTASHTVIKAPAKALSKAKPVAHKPAVRPPQHTQPAGNVAHSAVHWQWPVKGPIVHPFIARGDKRNPGIDIAGQLGQEIHAAAAGKVVYSGSGLRGYGKLIIIKHSDVYLSAYAHNNKLVVKEGAFVKAGQKIAEMGKRDPKHAGLHFEVRRFGQPIDPRQLLPRAVS